MLYDENFYKIIKESSRVSSERIIPLVKNTLNEDIRSVVDFGCGTGIWLKEWEKNGATLIKVFETGENQNDLAISNELISRVDLNFLPKNTLGEKYDLAMTLEVAEHLPETSAKNFIDAICTYSDKILFSGAIPHQGGIGHINEKFPSYWEKFFNANGFICYDVIRGQIWYDPIISIWYIQNTLLFIKGETFLKPTRTPLDIVHPFFWNIKC